jgi:hypothetical protein
MATHAIEERVIAPNGWLLGRVMQQLQRCVLRHHGSDHASLAALEASLSFSSNFRIRIGWVDREVVQQILSLILERFAGGFVCLVRFFQECWTASA